MRFNESYLSSYFDPPEPKYVAECSKCQDSIAENETYYEENLSDEVICAKCYEEEIDKRMDIMRDHTISMSEERMYEIVLTELEDRYRRVNLEDFI